MCECSIVVKETPAVMNDEVFENYKEDRRNDFNKV